MTELQNSWHVFIHSNTVRTFGVEDSCPAPGIDLDLHPSSVKKAFFSCFNLNQDRTHIKAAQWKWSSGVGTPNWFEAIWPRALTNVQSKRLCSLVEAASLFWMTLCFEEEIWNTQFLLALSWRSCESHWTININKTYLPMFWNSILCLKTVRKVLAPLSKCVLKLA